MATDITNQGGTEERETINILSMNDRMHILIHIINTYD